MQADEMASELELYIENTGELYPQKKAIIANIKRKLKSGRYNHTLAPKLWLYWVDAGAKRFLKEFRCAGVRMQDIFPRPVRVHIATRLADEYLGLIERGEV